MPYKVSRKTFENLVEEALSGIPTKYLKHLKNITVRIEDYPDDETLKTMGMRRSELLGLFSGVGHSSPGFFETPSPLPDSIILYQKNLEAVSESREKLLEEIRVTIIHEIGHYFGLSDDDLAQYKY